MLASDHRGFDCKNHLKDFLLEKSYQIIDVGTFLEEKQVDYPDFGFKAAEFVSTGKADRGILLCLNGTGMQIVANKVKNIRAALCLNLEMAQFARSHNGANILIIATKYTDYENVEKITETFLTKEFEGGRHLRRTNQIKEYEGK